MRTMHLPYDEYEENRQFFTIVAVAPKNALYNYDTFDSFHYIGYISLSPAPTFRLTKSHGSCISKGFPSANFSIIWHMNCLLIK
jgi:hypothetical protein